MVNFRCVFFFFDQLPSLSDLVVTHFSFPCGLFGKSVCPCCLFRCLYFLRSGLSYCWVLQLVYHHVVFYYHHTIYYSVTCILEFTRAYYFKSFVRVCDQIKHPLCIVSQNPSLSRRFRPFHRKSLVMGGAK